MLRVPQPRLGWLLNRYVRLRHFDGRDAPPMARWLPRGFLSAHGRSGNSPASHRHYVVRGYCQAGSPSHPATQ